MRRSRIRCASYDPSKEALPLLFNVPQMRVIGETVLVLDDRGRPSSVAAGPQTIVRPSTRQGPRQHLVLITRTIPKEGFDFPPSLEISGDAVTVSGFTFDARAQDGTAATQANATLIVADGVTHFRIAAENNAVRNGNFGIRLNGYLRDHSRLQAGDPAPMRSTNYATLVDNDVSQRWCPRW